MPNPQSIRSRSAVVCLAGLGVVAVLMLVLPAAARAAEEAKGYGELTRFGETETGPGAGQLAERRTRAIGVDPTDNSVYVVDEPQAADQKAGKLERHFRLQKFTAGAEGKYSLKASVLFNQSSPPFVGGSDEPPIEGIAVDPKEKRVYLLAVDIRKKSLPQDATEPGGFGELFVASTLFAFSTQESGAALVPAGKEGEHKEILTGPEALHAQSEVAGEALLAPRGITVAPESGDVIVLGHVDPNKGAKVDALPKDHYALQRIHADGTLGSRYTDSTDKLKSELPEGTFKPSSPVVVAAGGKEHVELTYGGIVEIPSEGPATRLIANPEEGIAEGISGSATGGRLAAGPEATVWGATGSIRNETAPEPAYAGLMAFSGLTGSEIGWTGGQAAVEPEVTRDKCVIDPYVKGELQHTLAAGSGGNVFVLAPEFLLREEEEEIENEKEEIEIIKTPLPGPFFPAIIEFGPGGTGCPQASATSPVAKVGGEEVKPGESVKPETLVTLSSHVKQADALKTEWNFGDGTPPQLVATDQFQNTKVEHKFEKEGTFTITEKIFSDDLASPGQVIFHEAQLLTPTITVTRTLTVSPPRPKPEFSIEPGSAVGVGQTATFMGEASDPNGPAARPLEFSWDFGDGTKSSGASTVSHSYGVAGEYPVTLTVTDKLGFKGAITHTISVMPPPPPPPPPPPGGTTTTTTTTTSTTAMPPAKHEVQSYQASLASTALAVGPNGSLVLTVRCLGKSSCTGNVTLRTLKAVSAAKKQILVLGSGSFAVAGGASKKVTVRLSGKARKLLARSHSLAARAAIVARDSSGALHTTQATVTLRLAKGKHH